MAAAAKTATKAPLTLSQLAAKIRHKGAGEMAYFSGLTHEEAGQLLAIAERLQAENTRMREMLKWEQQVHRMPNVKPADKLVLIATRREEEYQRPRQGKDDDDGTPVDMCRPAVAERVAVSPATVGDSWKVLHEMGAIEKKRRQVTNKQTGEKVQQLSIALTPEALANPLALAPKEVRRQGGRTDRGATCQKCGSTRIIEKVTRHCPDCGLVQKWPDGSEVKERYINPPEETQEAEEAEEIIKGQVDLLTPALAASGLEPVVMPSPDTAAYCEKTVDHRHRYGNFRTVDYRRICQYCATPEEKPYLTAAKVL